jgi:hypothetical protein
VPCLIHFGFLSLVADKEHGKEGDKREEIEMIGKEGEM